VGDGKSIKVCGEKWLPTPTTYAVQTPPRIIDDIALVADIIDAELQG